MTWSGDQPPAGTDRGRTPPPPGWGPPGAAAQHPVPCGAPLPPLPPHLKPNNGPAILISVAAVIAMLAMIGGVIALGVYAIDKADAATAKAGDCIDFTVETAPRAGEVGAAVAQKISCDDADAAYLVGLRLDELNATCPSQAYASYLDDGLFGAYTLCLIPNVSDGDCFVESQTRTDRFPCAEGPKPDAIRVLRVVRGAADQSRCAAFGDRDVLVLTYPTPPTTICFEQFGPQSSTGGGRNV